MASLEVGLFEIVPWTHGYAHSWALRWMLCNHEPARAAVLDLFAPGHAGWVVQDVGREYRVNRNRADLRVLAVDPEGREHPILVETKVNDAVRDAQLRAYCENSADVVIYAPGLTGLLLAGNDAVAHERWVTGRELLDALGELDLPDLVRSYLTEVEVQADRMDAARAAARGETPSLPCESGLSGVSSADVKAVACVAEVASAMRAAGGDGVITRDTAYDFGVFWSGSWREIPGLGGAGAYVDVIAGHGGSEYAIAIKVSEGTVDDRFAAFEIAHAPPRTGRWRRGRRRRTAGFRLWSLDASEMTAGEAADQTLQLEDFLDAVAAR